MPEEGSLNWCSAVNCHGVWSDTPMDLDELTFQSTFPEAVHRIEFQGKEHEVAEWIEGAKAARAAFANMAKAYIEVVSKTASGADPRTKGVLAYLESLAKLAAK